MPDKKIYEVYGESQLPHRFEGDLEVAIADGLLTITKYRPAENDPTCLAISIVYAGAPGMWRSVVCVEAGDAA